MDKLNTHFMVMCKEDEEKLSHKIAQEIINYHSKTTMETSLKVCFFSIRDKNLVS